MFIHSIPVPRLYKAASKILKKHNTENSGLESLIYGTKHQDIRALYAIVAKTVQYDDELELLLKKSNLLNLEPRLDPWLAKCLITELLWGKQCLKSDSKPIKTILSYEQILKAHLSDIPTNNDNKNKVEIPRYVRINRIKISVEEAIKSFQDEGWILQNIETNNYEEFLEILSNLDGDYFIKDFHISDLLIFPPKTTFYNHEGYKNGFFLLQDKATCFPVFILNPPPESIVLDVCAAPGMKTMQIAACLKNKGKIYAVDKDEKRLSTLKELLIKTEINCVKIINSDALNITKNDCPDVEYILVDPSCSGSGIHKRFKPTEKNAERLDNLSKFQVMLLKHTLRNFPNVKRIVYSTCSLYPEENENVVKEAIESTNKFKLVPAANFIDNKWINFGITNIGPYCLYSLPETDFTSGFFLAVFERLKDGEVNEFFRNNLCIKKQEINRKRKYNLIEIHDDNEARNKIFNNKKKKKYNNVNIKNETSTEINCNIAFEISCTKQNNVQNYDNMKTEQIVEINEYNKNNKTKTSNIKKKRLKNTNDMEKDILEINDCDNDSETFNIEKKKMIHSDNLKKETFVDVNNYNSDNKIEKSTKKKKKIQHNDDKKKEESKVKNSKNDCETQTSNKKKKKLKNNDDTKKEILEINDHECDNESKLSNNIKKKKKKKKQYK